MSRYTMFDKPATAMARDLLGRTGSLQLMTPPTGLGFRVEVEFDGKVERTVGKDPLLHQQMNDAIQDVYRDLVEEVAKALTEADAEVQQLMGRRHDKPRRVMIEQTAKNIDKARERAAVRAQNAVAGVWDTLQKSRKDYRTYRLKIASKITLATAGLGSGIALLAASVVTFGATSIPSIVAMVKSVVAVTAEISSAMQDMEAAQLRLNRHLGKIERSFVDAQGRFRKAGKTQEAGLALLAQLTGTSGALAVRPWIRDAARELSVVKGKYEGLVLHSHRLAKDLRKILKEIDKAKEDLRKQVKAERARRPHVVLTQTDAGAIDDRMERALAPFTADVQSLLDRVNSELGRLETAVPRIALAQARLKDLADLKGAGWKIFENILPFTDLALTITTWGAGGAHVLKELAANAGRVGGKLAAEKLSKLILEGTVLE